MKFEEAMKNKDISYIRQPHWNDSACLELPPWIEDTNSRGVWCHLIDLGNRIPICIIEFHNDSYDQYQQCEKRPHNRTITREELFKEFDRKL